jgi:hypothetical protein
MAAGASADCGDPSGLHESVKAARRLGESRQAVQKVKGFVEAIIRASKSAEYR